MKVTDIVGLGDQQHTEVIVYMVEGIVYL